VGVGWCGGGGGNAVGWLSGHRGLWCAGGGARRLGLPQVVQHVHAGLVVLDPHQEAGLLHGSDALHELQHLRFQRVDAFLHLRRLFTPPPRHSGCITRYDRSPNEHTPAYTHTHGVLSHIESQPTDGGLCSAKQPTYVRFKVIQHPQALSKAGALLFDALPQPHQRTFLRLSDLVTIHHGTEIRRRLHSMRKAPGTALEQWNNTTQRPKSLGARTQDPRTQAKDPGPRTIDPRYGAP